MAIIPGGAGQNNIIDTPQKQKNRNLLFVLLALVIFTGLIAYFGFGNFQLGGAPVVVDQQVEESNKILDSLRKVSLNNSVFADKTFQSLVQSEKLPVVVGEKGRANPFASF